MAPPKSASNKQWTSTFEGGGKSESYLARVGTQITLKYSGRSIKPTNQENITVSIIPMRKSRLSIIMGFSVPASYSAQYIGVAIHGRLAWAWRQLDGRHKGETSLRIGWFLYVLVLVIFHERVVDRHPNAYLYSTN